MWAGAPSSAQGLNAENPAHIGRQGEATEHPVVASPVSTDLTLRADELPRALPVERPLEEGERGSLVPTSTPRLPLLRSVSI